MSNAISSATVGFIVSGAVTLASLFALAALSGTFILGDSDVSRRPQSPAYDTFKRELDAWKSGFLERPVESSSDVKTLIVEPLEVLLALLAQINDHEAWFSLARENLVGALNVFREVFVIGGRGDRAAAAHAIAIIDSVLSKLDTASVSNRSIAELPGAIRAHYARLLNSQSKGQEMLRGFKKIRKMDKDPVEAFKYALWKFDSYAVARNATDAATTRFMRDRDVNKLMELVGLLQAIDGPYAAHFDANKTLLLEKLQNVLDIMGTGVSATVFEHVYRKVSAASTPADLAAILHHYYLEQQLCQGQDLFQELQQQ